MAPRQSSRIPCRIGGFEMRIDKGDSVRAISRGLSVLQVINEHGSLTMMGIATKSNLPYPTTCRIVQTLLDEGMIEQEIGGKRYRPTALVHTLSNGFQIEDRLVAIARPHIVRVTKDLIWPVSLCTRVGMNMVVKDSTHRLTSLTFSLYHTGMMLPLLETSCGRAYLAFCKEEERQPVLRGFARLNRMADGYRARLTEALHQLDQTRRLGIATSQCNQDGPAGGPSKNASIAVPIFARREIVGSLALTFFSSVMTMEQAINELAGRLKEAASDIGRDLGGSAPVANDPVLLDSLEYACD